MTDNASGNDQFVSKSDLQVMIAAIKQEFASSRETERAEMLKEFDVRENKIHSSYKSQFKKLGLKDDGDKTTASNPETDEAIQKLLKRAEEADARTAEAERKASLAQQRNQVSDLLSKNGINPKALDLVHNLLDAKKSLVDGKWKVSVDGTEVALPMDQAVKYFIKSPEAEFFMAPKTEGGGTTTSNPTDASKKSTTSGRRLPEVQVDWTSVMNDQSGEGGGNSAPPFQSF